MVPIQLKNFMPVGTAMRNVRNEKNGSSTWPVANMWCAQTLIDSAAIATVAPTMPLYPNSGLRLNTGMTSVTMPKNGSATMYTSGWPKNQNRCWYITGPPEEGSKMCVPSLRSASSASSVAASTGKAISTSRLVSSTFQVNIG